MTILLMFRFFYYVWFNDSEDLCFIVILKEKITRFWHLILLLSLKFEVSVPLISAAC